LAAIDAQGKSQVLVNNRSPDDKDQLKWKWNRGEAVDLADFGAPDTSTNTMALCIYDRRGLHRQLDLPPGGVVATCSGKPCWTPSGTTGFKYKNSDGVPDGITSAKLKAGADGRSQVQIRAKGANLLPPETEDLSGVVVQLLIDDGSETQCFKTSFSDAAVSAQDPERFKAKGP
jgi:hypothetical protein